MSNEDNTIENILGLDRLIHEPARLAILTVLSIAESADFAFIMNSTKLTKGNLSSHLSKLEKGNLIEIEKTFVSKTPKTFVKLTPQGEKAIGEYWKNINKLSKNR